MSASVGAIRRPQKGVKDADLGAALEITRGFPFIASGSGVEIDEFADIPLSDSDS